MRLISVGSIYCNQRGFGHFGQKGKMTGFYARHNVAEHDKTRTRSISLTSYIQGYIEISFHNAGSPMMHCD